MIAPWLLYATALGALLGCAALALERIADATRRPTRWVWSGAVALSVLLPVVANFLAAPAAPHAGPGGSLATRQAPSVDMVLLALWAAASLLVVARVVAAMVILRRRRRSWREAAIDGTPVLLTESVGPALIGLAHPRPLLPAWALALGAESRALILRHEAEHARARDPWLLALGMAGIAAMPWNPALWWLVRRLRLAVEIDCDARVLRAGADPRAYASLLLAVGERHARIPYGWATALAEPRSLLERRILAMTTPRTPRRPFLAIALPAAGAAIAVLVACEAPLPEQVVPVPSVAAAPAAGRLTLRSDGAQADTLRPTLRAGQVIVRDGRPMGAARPLGIRQLNRPGVDGAVRTVAGSLLTTRDSTAPATVEIRQTIPDHR